MTKGFGVKDVVLNPFIYSFLPHCGDLPAVLGSSCDPTESIFGEFIAGGPDYSTRQEPHELISKSWIISKLNWKWNIDRDISIEVANNKWDVDRDSESEIDEINWSLTCKMSLLPKINDLIQHLK